MPPTKYFDIPEMNTTFSSLCPDEQSQFTKAGGVEVPFLVYQTAKAAYAADHKNIRQEQDACPTKK